jgi:hypothetical protein
VGEGRRGSEQGLIGADGEKEERRAVGVQCYVSAGTFTRLGLCRLLYDKALVSRVLRLSYEE